MKKWRRTFAEQNFNNNNVMVKRLTGSIVLALMLGTANVANAVGDKTLTLKENDNMYVVKSPKRAIMGVVCDENGEPILGATIHSKRSGETAVTDVNGKFTVNVTNDDELICSYLGFQEKKVKTDKQDNLKIVLKEDAALLDELVVIGYGTVKKKDLTGSVANTDGESVAKAQTTSLAQSLQGLMPGVDVTRTSGTPAASASIKIRGITTISDSSPLVIVDGIPVQSIDDVDADMVENITVLKDAASASIYGSRAAAGVILITTKRAEKGQLSISYHGTLGVIKRTSMPESVSPTRYLEMMNEVAWNDGGNQEGNEYPVYSKDYIENYMANNAEDPDQYPLTDWRNLLLKKTAYRHKHRLAMTYGNDIIKTNAMVSYENATALYNHYDLEHINCRVNNDIKFNKFISASVDVNFIREDEETPNQNPLFAALTNGPTVAALWSDGRIGEGHNGSNTYARLEYGGTSKYWLNRFYGKVSLILTPFKGMTITGVINPSISTPSRKTLVKQIPYYSAEDPQQLMGYIDGYEYTQLTEKRNEQKSMTKQLIMDYRLPLKGGHSLALMAGYEDYYYKAENLTAVGDRLPLSEFPYLDRAPQDYIFADGNATENAYQSYFGRLTYDWNNRYLLQANVRCDGSSRFHKDHRWGTFPSVSAGWVITEEPFWQKASIKAIDFLKIRASYGKLGNERIGSNYPYQSIMNLHSVLMHEGDGISSLMSAAQEVYNIKNISWETTTSWNLGIDMTMLRGRLSFTGEIYRKNTSDMLLDLEIPSFMGYSKPSQNAGDMHTNGWEIQTQWRDKIGDVKYSIGVHVSDYKSVMGNLSGLVLDGDNIICEGSEYNEWYGYMSDGLFQSEEDIKNSPLLFESVRPGDVKYKDISGPDGVPDGKVTAEYDRVLLGGSLPRYNYGGNISVGWKGLDFSMVFQGVGKRKCRMTDKMTYQTTGWFTFPEMIDGNYWSAHNTEEENLNARFPRLSQVGYKSNNYVMSDFWLFDGAYFRCKNITLGYVFPKKLIKALTLSKLRIYASVSDPFVFSHFPEGWDPEQSETTYIARTWNFGAVISF